MRILHIVPAFYPNLYHGGLIVYNLCNALARHDGIEVRVLTTDAAKAPGKKAAGDQCPIPTPLAYLVYYCRKRFAVSVAPGMLWHMAGLVRWADLVHLTEVYSFPSIPSLLVCRILRKPVVWSPHGALQRWEGSRRIALKAIWERVSRSIAPQRLLLQVTSEQEARESAERLPGVETAMVLHGVEIPDKVLPTTGNGVLRILYLGRLDPIKGIENLLEACGLLNHSSSVSWSLTIAGAGDVRYSRSIRERIDKLGVSQQVILLGEVTGESKEALFGNTDVLVAPSHKESFCMVVAEALAHSVPVIVSRGTPWQRVEKMRCGLWVDNAPESLAKAIEQMARMPRCEMGQRGRDWMQREFSWAQRASEMIDIYAELSRQ